MSFLITRPTPSYAHEQLYTQLSALSTLPISLSSPQNSLAASPTEQHPDPDSTYEHALHTLSSPSCSRDDLIDVLRSLARQTGSGMGPASLSASRVDRALHAEVLGRAVTVVWKQVIEVLIDAAQKVDEERGWWEGSLTSRRGVLVYLVQSLPLRLYRAIEPRGFSLSFESLQHFKFPARSALFRPLPNASSALSSITSPYTLTRREMLSSVKALTSSRDSIAQRIGLLAAEGPHWGKGGNAPSSDVFISNDDASPFHNEIHRLHTVLLRALDAPPLASPKRRASSLASSPSVPTPEALLTLLTAHLPRAQSGIDSTLNTHRRPSALTRLWFPLLFLPPALLAAARTLAKNKEWMREQIRSAKETVKGFVVQWVWEPLEDIGKTLRTGGEGLGVAPTTVKSDQESLERMVLDLGRDYYNLSGPELTRLGDKVRAGDMEEVLRVYEKELQSPVKNALMGSLIRTLLIQVQKTKTDLSLSLLSLDHLLRSQQLTFAAVGVAPSVLVLYGLGGWARGVWRGEKRGKGRRRRYYYGIREIERILLTAPKAQDEMSDRDRGLLIVSVTGMRTWAAGLGGTRREAFLGDLRMVEDPELRRVDKLRVVERIWRCFGVDGRVKV